MQAEQIEILDFLRRHPPFSELDENQIAHVAAQVEVVYFKAGTAILELGQEVDAFYMIRSGSVELFRRNGELYNRLGEGGYFGEFGLLRNRRVRFPAVALEDSLVYRISETLFNELFDENELFADAVEVEDRTRLRQAVARREDANELMSSPIRRLITRTPATLGPEVSARDAAIRMTEEVVSAVLVVGPKDKSGDEHRDTDTEILQILGIVTDRDLRDRLISAGLDYDTTVTEIMSPHPVTVDARKFVFEAMLLMLRHNIHHLPVVDQGQPLGIIELPDIIRYESQNSLFVVSSIFRQHSPQDLATLKSDVRSCFLRMVHEDANSHMIGSALAVIGRSFKQRLLELAEEKLGPPPIPYCFLALGSMARDDQTVVTDQDNALVLDNSYQPEVHGAYFEALARFVSDGLDACGYVYCSGDIMATNPEWRQPLKVWEDYFNDWIDNPTPQFLLNSSVFFDLNGVWGRTDWADRLYRLIVSKARRNPRFLACMARNGLLRTPPLGFFKDFVMETDGKHSRFINIKRRGTAPLNDLIRVHALAVGSTSLNSFDRLRDVIDAGILQRGRGNDLLDALEFISMVRIRHQALDLEAGREPDNNIEPENLSDFERRHLKDAFQLLSNAQKFLKYHYTANRPI